MRSTLVAALIVLALAMPSAAGVVIPVQNSSFEDYVLGGDNLYTTDGTGLTGYGWSISDNDQEVGVWDPIVGDNFDFIPDGDQVAYTQGPSISQLTGETVMAGRTYTLKVWVGQSTIALAGSRIQLVAAGDVLAEDVVGEDSGPGFGQWFDRSVSFQVLSGDAHIGDALVIRLATTVDGPGRETSFDDVRLTYVPEPATLGLLSLGGMALLKRKS